MAKAKKTANDPEETDFDEDEVRVRPKKAAPPPSSRTATTAAMIPADPFFLGTAAVWGTGAACGTGAGTGDGAGAGSGATACSPR